MKSEIKYSLYLIGLGATLIAYGHTQFQTKYEARAIKEQVVENKEFLKRIDSRIYDLWKNDRQPK